MKYAFMMFYTGWWTFINKSKAVAHVDKVPFARMELGLVVMQPIELSDMDFGFEDEEDLKPVMPDRLFHKGQSSDDTHGSW